MVLLKYKYNLSSYVDYTIGVRSDVLFAVRAIALQYNLSSYINYTSDVLFAVRAIARHPAIHIGAGGDKYPHHVHTPTLRRLV